MFLQVQSALSIVLFHINFSTWTFRLLAHSLNFILHSYAGMGKRQSFRWRMGIIGLQLASWPHRLSCHLTQHCLCRHTQDLLYVSKPKQAIRALHSHYTTFMYVTVQRSYSCTTECTRRKNAQGEMISAWTWLDLLNADKRRGLKGKIRETPGYFLDHTQHSVAIRCSTVEKKNTARHICMHTISFEFFTSVPDRISPLCTLCTPFT